jgi:hypothetical protein
MSNVRFLCEAAKLKMAHEQIVRETAKLTLYALKRNEIKQMIPALELYRKLLSAGFVFKKKYLEKFPRYTIRRYRQIQARILQQTILDVEKLWQCSNTIVDEFNDDDASNIQHCHRRECRPRQFLNNAEFLQLDPILNDILLILCFLKWLVLQMLFYGFSMFPGTIRPRCTTMPWSIWPALVVLWGVCWMFIYPGLDKQAEHDKGLGSLIDAYQQGKHRLLYYMFTCAGS